MAHHTAWSVLLVTLLALSIAAAPARFTIGGLFEFSETVETPEHTQERFTSPADLQSLYSAYFLAIQDINNNPAILPSTTLEPLAFDTDATTAGALAALVEAKDAGLSVVIGPSFSEQSRVATVAADLYNILLASPSASAAILSTSFLYPMLVRAVPPDTQQALAMIDLIDYYYNQSDRVEQWRQVSVVCTADDYGVGGARNFIDSAAPRNISTIVFQQFINGAEDVSVEVRELEVAKGRVFVSFMRSADWQTLIREAGKQDIVGQFFVWICSDGCATREALEDQQTGEVIRKIESLSLGYQGTLPRGGTGEAYEEYLRRWMRLDEDEFPGAGRTPTPFSLYAYDMTTAVALALDAEFEKGNDKPTGRDLFAAIVGVRFVGLTGDWVLEPNGDRYTSYEIQNLQSDREFRKTFIWNNNTGLQFVRPAEFFIGDEVIPDLSVEEEFYYWSCHDGERRLDVTGKTINRRKPDGDDVDEIDSQYECDGFIDCQNLSDEAYQCTPSYTVAFIVLGILTGLLVLSTVCCIPLVCVFGFCVRRHRIFLSGTVFLVVVLIACVVGYISTYAWYGKPHTVACNFQLWLFGLSSSALAAALCAKQFRFFRSTAATDLARKLTKSDKKGASNFINHELEFLIIWVVLMLFPLVIIILWQAISTPEATLIEVDDLDHWMCTSEGVTGSAGGLAWFFILVGYDAILLLLSLVFGYLVRKVPKPFMDNKLTSISAFNLGFLTAVIVPVFLVLRFISPFAAWIVRTLGMLYGFSSTVLIHLVPKVIGLFLVDRLQPNAGDGKALTRRNMTATDQASVSASQSQG